MTELATISTAETPTRRPVTMWTSAKQTAFIDEIAVCIRLRCGRVLSRGEIVSAIIEAVLRGGCDLGQAASEADVVAKALDLFRPSGH